MELCTNPFPQAATLLKMYIRRDLSFYYLQGVNFVLVSCDSQLTDLAGKTLFITKEVGYAYIRVFLFCFFCPLHRGYCIVSSYPDSSIRTCSYCLVTIQNINNIITVYDVFSIVHFRELDWRAVTMWGSPTVTVRFASSPPLLFQVGVWLRPC